jgi:hypothetical protein
MLGTVQCAGNQRYYGSGHLVRRTAEIAGGEPVVLVSDREGGALEALLKSGLEPLETPNFDPENSYSIFDAEVDGDLLLVDPFARFLVDHAPEVIPKIDRLSKRMAVLLFVLDLDKENWVGQRYAALKDLYFNRAWVARCPKLLNTSVRGESKHDAGVALLMPREQHQSAQDQLSPRLLDYCRRLSEVLETEVTFEAPREDYPRRCIRKWLGLTHQAA